MRKNLSTNKIFNQIKTLIVSARNRVVQAVNTTMVYTYFEIGRIIIEHEQGGKEKAQYGAETLKELSKKLTKEFGKGFTKRNLELMRQFYLTYRKAKTLSSQSQRDSNLSKKFPKSHTLSDKSKKSEILSPKFTISWSHYVFLMRLNKRERIFYEREATENNWSLRELKRQYDSALFERIVLSKEKKGVLENNLNRNFSGIDFPIELALPYRYKDMWLPIKNKLHEIIEFFKAKKITILSIHAAQGKITEPEFLTWGIETLSFADELGVKLITIHPNRVRKNERKEQQIIVKEFINQLNGVERFCIETFGDRGRVFRKNEIIELGYNLTIELS